MKTNGFEEKQCSKCKKILPLTDFYSKGNGKFRSECKSCHSNYVKEKYLERKQEINEIKSKYSCQKCGEDRNYVLDFHHIDPATKEMSIARMTSNNNHMDKIKEEISKCVILCANCHREFHYLHGLDSNFTLEQYLTND